MELPRRLATALQAIDDAVERLEAMAGRRQAGQLAQANARGELAMMEEDRMRLAGELGRSLAHNQALLAANAEVGERLDHVVAALHALMPADQDGEPADDADPGPHHNG